jgi:DNA-binding GntR family transcriptional regulator
MKNNMLRNTAYEKIREGILRRDIKLGEPLVEETLARKLGMSRTPVREALATLLSEGILAKHSKRGNLVVERPTLGDLLEIYDVREVIEGLAARQLAYKVTEAQIEDFRYRAERLDRFEAGAEADVRLHEDLVQSSGNRLALETLRTFRLRAYTYDQYTHSLRTEGKLTYLPDFTIRFSHGSLIEALQAHDPVRAEEAARGHVREGKDVILQCLKMGFRLPE